MKPNYINGDLFHIKNTTEGRQFLTAELHVLAYFVVLLLNTSLTYMHALSMTFLF